MANKDTNRFYVYLHRRGDNNEVFYIGKGTGNRANVVWGRNPWWKRIYEKCGRVVEYIEKGLSEQDAYDLETETIKFYKECGYTLCNLTDGGEGVPGEYMSVVARKHDIYDLVNSNTGETFSCTQYDLVEIHGLSWSEASRVASGERAAKGISLVGYSRPRPESKVYEFLCIDTNEVINLTCIEASKYFNMNLNSIYSLARGNMRTCKGITIKGR